MFDVQQCMYFKRLGAGGGGISVHIYITLLVPSDAWQRSYALHAVTTSLTAARNILSVLGNYLMETRTFRITDTNWQPCCRLCSDMTRGVSTYLK